MTKAAFQAISDMIDNLRSGTEIDNHTVKKSKRDPIFFYHIAG